MCRVGNRNFGGKFAHHRRRRRNFRYRFHFDAKTGQNGRNLLRRHFAAHNLAHQVGHFVIKKLVVVYQAGDCLLWGNHGCSFAAFQNKAA